MHALSKSKENNPSTSVVIKSSFWYTISNFLTRALVFITTPIFTRILSTEQFGNFHVFANWQNTLFIIAGLEIYSTVNRARFDFKDEEDLNGYISTCLVISTFVTGILFAIYLLFSSTIDKLFLMDRSYVMIMFAYLFTRPAFEMFQAEQRIHYRYKLSAGISFFMVIFTSLLALFLAQQLTSDHLLGRIIGQYVPYIILGIGFYAFFLFRSRRISFSKAKYAIKLAIPLVFSYLGSQVLLASDKVIVQHLSSAEAVAYLGIATSCAHIMLILVQSLNNAWSPWFYDKLAAGDYQAIRKTFRIYLGFVLFSTWGALLVGPELVKILGGSSYAPAVMLLPANMLSGALTLIVSQFGAFETYYKKAHYAAVVTSIAAVINIVLDIIGVKLFGYIAASYVTVICYLFLLGFHTIATKNLGFFKVFSLKEFMLDLVIILAMMPAAILVYKNTFVRYLLAGVCVVAFAVLIIRKKDMLISVFKGNRSRKRDEVVSE